MKFSEGGAENWNQDNLPEGAGSTGSEAYYRRTWRAENNDLSSFCSLPHIFIFFYCRRDVRLLSILPEPFSLG